MLPTIQANKITWIVVTFLCILHFFPMIATAQFAGGSGTEEDPFQIGTIDQLQAIADSANLNKHFIQVADIEASVTGTDEWPDSLGFKPIGSRANSGESSPFTGSYDGNGFAIMDLYIHRPAEDYVGLFGYIYIARIENVSLINTVVTGKRYVGGLAGFNESGEIRGSNATGIITGIRETGGLIGMNFDGVVQGSSAGSTVSGDSHIGGLVGFNVYAHIIGSHAGGTVSGIQYIGGLVGYSADDDGISIPPSLDTVLDSCYATGDISGNRYVGGLAGKFSGHTISNSFATGSVSGEQRIGGLTGDSNGKINGSFATGKVTGHMIVGGLVGLEGGIFIIESYATGDVTGDSLVGGLVGQHSGWRVLDSYASGNVSGIKMVGGLVGYSISFITNSYATGNVSGNKIVGGLVGINQHHNIITHSYSTGQVTGVEDTGGFIGVNNSDSLFVGSYWNRETNTQNNSVGRGDSIGIKDLTTDQMTGEDAFIHMYKLDFKEAWQLTEGYPVLAWKETENSVDPPEVPIVSVTPEFPDFGEVETDSAHTMELLLKNKGLVTLSGEVLPLGTEASAFEIIRGEGEWMLEPDSSHIIEIAFQPSGEDTFLVVLEINHDAPNEANPLEVTLTGTGKTAVNINPEEPLPKRFELLQNYPNPFNPVTQIRYTIPEQTQVRLEVFNAIGQRVSTLVNEIKTPGNYEATFDASGLSSGLYLYRLHAESHTESRLMLLIK